MQRQYSLLCKKTRAVLKRKWEEWPASRCKSNAVKAVGATEESDGALWSCRFGLPSQVHQETNVYFCWPAPLNDARSPTTGAQQSLDTQVHSNDNSSRHSTARPGNECVWIFRSRSLQTVPPFVLCFFSGARVLGLAPFLRTTTTTQCGVWRLTAASTGSISHNIIS